MSDTAYKVEFDLMDAAGYFTPAQSKSYYGKYSRDGVVYHWWNKPERIADSEHGNIVNMMKRNASRGAAPTVNYVASGDRLTLLASPDLVTWCSNNGNPSTIGVECSPHFTDKLYKKLGWLHDQLEQRYNKTLAIYVHFDWTPTECSPISKSRIRQEADKWKALRNIPAPKPAPAPVPPTVTVQVQDIPNKKVRTIRPANMWDLGFRTFGEAKALNPTAFPNGFPQGHVIEDVSAIATHPTGAKYYITEYSFARGIKKGINVKDVEDYTDPITPQPAPIPPKPAPPAPVEVPLTVEQRLTLVEKFLKRLGFK